MNTKSEKELLQICIENSGEHLAAHHPSTSFATQYSDTFVEAAAELYSRFEMRDKSMATIALYIAMRDAEVPSCRGGTMTFDKVQYLIKRPINSSRCR